jgi:hypothetical protein
VIQSQSRQIIHETLSQKKNHTKGLLEWLKVEALSSSPCTAKKKKKKERKKKEKGWGVDAAVLMNE